MYDAENPDRIINEFLITIFLPGIIVFVGLWAAFALVFDNLLLAYGLPPIEPASGRRAIAGGYGRLVLLVVLTTALLLPYIGLYRRFLREPLRKRDLV